MRLRKFTFASFALLLCSLSGWAGDKPKVGIQLDQPIHVGSTQLAPGEYKMTWTQSGSSAEVTFWQGKKVVATVPAQATREHSEYRGPALRVDPVSQTLMGVFLPELSLSFTSKNAAPAGAGN